MRVGLKLEDSVLLLRGKRPEEGEGHTVGRAEGDEGLDGPLDLRLACVPPKVYQVKGI